MEFEERLRFEGDPEALWKRVSSVEDIPKYWHGTRSLELIRRDRNTAYVKVRFAFGGSGAAAVTADESTRTLRIDYTSGPFIGTQTVAVAGNDIVTKWDVRAVGAFRLVSRWNEGHFKSGTRHALQRLVRGEPGLVAR